MSDALRPLATVPANVPYNYQHMHLLVGLREHVNVVFIGHVDAGKSTIGGQILFLTGGVDERTIQKYER